jgi:CBS domain-containing protein
MERTGTDAVLVVERDRLVGIVTSTDLVRSLAPSAGQDGTSDPGRG